MSGVGRAGENMNEVFSTLIEENSSAIVVKDGQYDTSARMALSSGLHRFFGQEKSAKDVQANQATLVFLLKQIQKNTGASTEEMMRIGEGKIRLGGETEGRSVIDRLSQGTYVSSELVRQLQVITYDVLNPRLEKEADEDRKAQEAETRKLQEAQEQEAKKRLEMQDRQRLQDAQNEAGYKVANLNEKRIQIALGRVDKPERDEDLPDADLAYRKITVPTGEPGRNANRPATTMETALLPHRDGSQTALAWSLEELARTGTPEHPREEVGVWQAFDDYWIRGLDPTREDGKAKAGEREKLLDGFAREISREGYNRAFSPDERGRPLDPKDVKGLSDDDIKTRLKEMMSSPQQMEKFTAIAQDKAEKTERERLEAIAKAERERLEAIAASNSKIVSEMGPKGLSDVLKQFLKDNPDLQDQGQRLLDALGTADEMARNLNLAPGEMRSASQILLQMRDGQVGPHHPFQLVDQLRTALKQSHDADPPGEELTTESISQRLGNTLRDILTANEPPPNVDEGRRAQLQGDLQELYPALEKLVSGQDLGAPTLSEVVRSLLSSQLEALALSLALKTAKEANKDISSPDVQREAAQKAKELLAKHRQAQQQVLKVLDQRVAIERQLKELRQGDGGLRGAPKETLRELDAQSDLIRKGAQALDDYIDMLKGDFGDGLGDTLKALESAQLEISLAIGFNYDRESGRQEREYLARVETRLEPLSTNTLPHRKQEWMTDGLHESVSSLPLARGYVEGLGSDYPGLQQCQSLTDVVNLVAYQPMRHYAEENARNKTTFFESVFKGDARVKEQTGLIDEMWEDVEKSLDNIQSFRPAPTPPPVLTTETIAEYRASLTEYIDQSRQIARDLDYVGRQLTTFIPNPGKDQPALEQSLQVLQRKLTDAGDAIGRSQGSVAIEIRQAEARLKALDDPT